MKGSFEKDVQEFIAKKALFEIGCDAAEEIGLWQTAERGEMKLYCENLVVSAVLRVIASDGRISADEIAFIREILELDYSKTEIEEIYSEIDFREEIGRFAQMLKEDLREIGTIRPSLAEYFGDILLLACRIITRLDGVSAEELRMTDVIRGALGT